MDCVERIPLAKDRPKCRSNILRYEKNSRKGASTFFAITQESRKKARITPVRMAAMACVFEIEEANIPIEVLIDKDKKSPRYPTEI